MNVDPCAREMKRNYFIVLALVAGLLIGLLEAYQLVHTRNTIINAAKQRNANIAKITSQRLSGAIREIDYIMRDIHDDISARMPALAGGPSRDGTRRLNAVLLRKINTHPWIFGLGIMNAKGIFVSGVNRTGPAYESVGADRSFREYFSYLATHPDEEAHCSGAFVEKSTQDTWFAYSRAVRVEDRPGLFGVIYAGLYAKNMAKLFGNPDFAESGAIAVVDTVGILLLRIPNASNANGKKAEFPELDSFLSKSSRPLQAITVSPWDGQPRICAFHKVEEFPYTVIVSSTVEDDLRQWRIQCYYQITSVVLIVGLLVGTAFLAGRLLKVKNQLEDQAGELERQAKTDPLTGISNRRHFFELAEREMSRSRRSDKPLALMMLDIDRFKHINDTYGHDMGDEVLKALCATSLGMIRNIDIFARLGGEEFAIMLPETTKAQAQTVAERLREKLSETYVLLPKGDRMTFTVSIGVSSITARTDNIESLLKLADIALYKAKRTGRNRVHI
jgi:diguanylate cyclase (GGDEF)-like protein